MMIQKVNDNGVEYEDYGEVTVGMKEQKSLISKWLEYKLHYH